MKRNKMVGACGSSGGEETCVQVLVGKPELRSYLEDLREDGKIILKLTLKKEYVRHELRPSGSGYGKWRAFENIGMKFYLT
jgi:hypothetical protein